MTLTPTFLDGRLSNKEVCRNYKEMNIFSDRGSMIYNITYYFSFLALFPALFLALSLALFQTLIVWPSLVLSDCPGVVGRSAKWVLLRKKKLGSSIQTDMA